MKIAHSLNNLSLDKKKSVVTIGVFDGVHKGHQKIVKTLVAQARKKKLPSVVLTFKPHPFEVIKEGSHPPILTSFKLKTELLRELKVDCLVEIPFTKTFARQSAKKFVEDILIKKLKVACLVVGEDFRFGAGSKGGISLLKDYAKKHRFEVIVIPKLLLDGKEVSSTQIRKLLKAGEITKAKEALGHFPRLTGCVVKGHQRGKKFGFATANLKTPDKASIPKNGVYAGFVRINKTRKPCVIDIGTSPTFGKTRTIVHTHIFHFDQDIYGKELEVEIWSYLRDEKAFSSEKELANQIKKDIEQAKKLLFSKKN